MLEKQEKLVMNYLSSVCVNKSTYLIFAEDIAENVFSKNLLTVNELDEILTVLSKENYIDFIAMEGKKGFYYCVNLKNKGITYKKDQDRAKKEVVITILKTVALGVLSFIIGFILRAIFKG